MMQVSVAERARLSALIGRRAFRSLLGGLNTHPLLRFVGFQGVTVYN